ncbi:hypothetical protein TVAG_207420 [Trichomonas vaginalis G3]|uniref:non-specific serine/threonine protein kinase n=1 Tax=Trichomonas vaginalis (strain ATCC PRA-98 / G3) TaxID=412133 RepID=A2F2K5_TRIV3|nr:casein kinase II subunit alpha family [Trichomonas vaginalis G3]EAY00839.1 hypothetical protein TVAG_207420 [Trichomonas vaginalis G3]KAI5544594.1 casein kinase II subunit alpha family [Trichomonas vaginalis G3]|eukprot:XP_001313768.1 hypothetical protein [Trichomonas vaginalis G3]
MQSRLNEFEKVEDYFEASNKSYEAYIASHKVSKRKFLITKYNLELLNVQPKLLYNRLMFLIKNYRMFRCECVFFQGHLASLEVLNPKILGKFIKYFYVVEPLPMVTLADFATENQMSKSILLEKLPNLLSTIAMMHSVKFAYLNISPFTIIVDGVFWLRPPSLMPYSSPKNCFAPPPQGFRAEYRSVNEMRFYRAPEWNANPMFCESDCWSLGCLLAEYMIFAGPLFGSISINDQMVRTQMICGPAPAFLNWPPAPQSRKTVFPPIIADMLSYDPRKRPLLCIHVSNQILQFIRDYNVGEEEEEFEEEEASYGEVSIGENEDDDSHISGISATESSNIESEHSDKSNAKSSHSYPVYAAPSQSGEEEEDLLQEKVDSPKGSQGKSSQISKSVSPDVNQISPITSNTSAVSTPSQQKNSSSQSQANNSLKDSPITSNTSAVSTSSQQKNSSSQSQANNSLKDSPITSNTSAVSTSSKQKNSSSQSQANNSLKDSPITSNTSAVSTPSQQKNSSSQSQANNSLKDSPITSNTSAVSTSSQQKNSSSQSQANNSLKDSPELKSDDNKSVNSRKSNGSNSSNKSLPKYASGEKKSKNSSSVEEDRLDSLGSNHDSPAYASGVIESDHNSVKSHSSHSSRHSSSSKPSYAVNKVPSVKEKKMNSDAYDYSSSHSTKLAMEEDYVDNKNSTKKVQKTKVLTSKTESSGNSHVTFSSGNAQFSGKSASSHQYTYSSSTDVQTEADALRERIKILEAQLQYQSYSEESINSDSSLDPTEIVETISKLKRDLNAMDSGLLSGSCVGCATGTDLENSLSKQEKILDAADEELKSD